MNPLQLGPGREMKVCRKCGTVKDIDEFHKNKSSPDGRRSVCRDCRNGQKLHIGPRYGLTPDQWDAMYNGQRGRCAICLEIPQESLQVDHCHTTGEVRGLLCPTCNRAIGLLRDIPENMMRAAIYVARGQGQRVLKKEDS